MAFADLKATEWSTLAYMEMLAQANIANVANKSFQGDASQRNNTVRVAFFDPSSLTVQSTIDNTTTVDSHGSNVDIAIDDEASVKFRLYDIDQMMIPVDLMSTYAQEAGAAIGRSVDTNIIATVSGACTSVAVTSYDTLVDARATLTANGYPADQNMWFFASSTQYKNLLKDDDVNRATTALGNNQVVSGEVRRIAGVNVVECPVNVSGGVLFHSKALAFVSKPGIVFESDRLLAAEKKFGSILGAYLVYGVKVLSTNGALHIKNT